MRKASSIEGASIDLGVKARRMLASGDSAMILTIDYNNERFNVIYKDYEHINSIVRAICLWDSGDIDNHPLCIMNDMTMELLSSLAKCTEMTMISNGIKSSWIGPNLFCGWSERIMMFKSFVNYSFDENRPGRQG